MENLLSLPLPCDTGVQSVVCVEQWPGVYISLHHGAGWTVGGQSPTFLDILIQYTGLVTS